MRASVRRPSALVAARMLGVAAAGCDTASPSNLSPTPDQAADRHERAVRYSERRASENQQAERKAMKRKHSSPTRK